MAKMTLKEAWKLGKTTFIVMFIIMFIITNLMFVIPRITSPTKPNNSRSQTERVMKELNYQSDSTLRNNILKNTSELGYLKFCLMMPSIAGVALAVIVVGFSAFDNKKDTNPK